MNQQHVVALMTVASIAMLGSPMLAQSSTRINDLQRTNSTIISGRVVSVVGNNFIVADGSGQIIVDAGPRRWRQINLLPGEQVIVTGELGRSGEFDAFSITRSNGSVIEIRSPAGPPPWAENPNRGYQPRRQGR